MEGSHGPTPVGPARYAFRQAGRERSYLVYVPRTDDGTRSLPVVVDLHGSGSFPEQELAISGLARAADRYGFLVVLPEAVVPMPNGGHTWNVPPRSDQPNDVAFVRDVLDDVGSRFRVVPDRIYVVGFSGGGRLASQVGCALAGRISGVAAVGGLRHPDSCAATRPVPVLAFHGTEDPINPCSGGGPPYWGTGVEDALRGWAEENGCASTSVVEPLSREVERVSFTGCSEGVSVTLYRLEGAGHVWPGSGVPLPPARFGSPADHPAATSVLLEAFGLRSTEPASVSATKDVEWPLEQPGDVLM